MEVTTLRAITTQISGRNIDDFIEKHLPEYALEINELLQAVNFVSRNFPLELSPAPTFALKEKNHYNNT